MTHFSYSNQIIILSQGTSDAKRALQTAKLVSVKPFISSFADRQL